MNAGSPRGPSKQLADELGAPLPPAFDSLNPEELATLTDAIASARAHQRAALEEATENGLGFVPRVLRGPIKKLIFG